jgi:hypothetical protein
MNVGDKVSWLENAGCFATVRNTGTIIRSDGDRVWIDAGWGTLETRKEYISPL